MTTITHAQYKRHLLIHLLATEGALIAWCDGSNAWMYESGLDKRSVIIHYKSPTATMHVFDMFMRAATTPERWNLLMDVERLVMYMNTRYNRDEV